MTKEFVCAVPPEALWAMITEPDLLLPFLPGVTVTPGQGGGAAGSIKLHLGPATVTYRGEVRVVERDDAARTAVIVAQGREARGPGEVRARVAVSLGQEDDEGEGDTTRLLIAVEAEGGGRFAAFEPRAIEAGVALWWVRVLEQVEAALAYRGGGSQMAPAQVSPGEPAGSPASPAGSPASPAGSPASPAPGGASPFQGAHPRPLPRESGSVVPLWAIVAGGGVAAVAAVWVRRRLVARLRRGGSGRARS